MATAKTPDPAPEEPKADEPAWMSDPSFNRNESQNYVEPQPADESGATPPPPVEPAPEPKSS